MKTERLDRGLSKIIKEASYLREKSDYDDFYIASKDEAKNQLENAESFLKTISEYLDEN